MTSNEQLLRLDMETALEEILSGGFDITTRDLTVIARDWKTSKEAFIDFMIRAYKVNHDIG